jgi:hypothetical protein
MKSRTKKMLAVVGVLSLNSALASDTIRCGNQLVSIGDSRAEVRHRCGMPDEVTHSAITQKASNHSHGRVRYAETFETEVQIQAESWLYNFGSNRFMSRLRFVDGRLNHIELLGYGYDRNSSEKANSDKKDLDLSR